MIKEYQKDCDYSYTLGIFPTIELLKSKIEEVRVVYVHPKAINSEGYLKIKKMIGQEKIIINENIFNKLSKKENCYVIGVFNKYYVKLDSNKDHIVLVNPSDMGNLGTIIRSSLGFGLTNIAIINPGADNFNPKVVRASMGAFFKVNIERFDSFEQYLLKYPRTWYSFMLQTENGLQNLKVLDDKVSLVFGNEATGLPMSYLNKDTIKIEQTFDIDSLNLPTAVAIASYTLSLQRK